jgi:uncharacterized protein
MNDYFIIPILNRYLFYAPLLRFGTLLEDKAADQIIQIQKSNPDDVEKTITSLFHLNLQNKEIIPFNENPKVIPLFLGLVTTRGCNMACRYCDFQAPKQTSPIISMDTAQKSLDMYFDLLVANQITEGQVEFFGGEPFFKNHTVEFALDYGRNKASHLGIGLKFSVTTNGIFSERKCEWIGDNFDRVTLSFDGTKIAQNYNRPLPNNKDSYDIVRNSAKILSECNADLIIRCCISDQTVTQMPEIAEALVHDFVTESICFEPLSPSDSTEKNKLLPPDPHRFAYYFLLSYLKLSAYGIDLITSGTDISVLQKSFCPLGKDALIVTPEGKINGCYLLEEEWKRHGLDLQIGNMINHPPFYEISPKMLSNTRAYNQIYSPICKNCFAKYHCAGGCHVHHPKQNITWDQDRLCIQTRLVIVGKLLALLNNREIMNQWLCSFEPSEN